MGKEVSKLWRKKVQSKITNTVVVVSCGLRGLNEWSSLIYQHRLLVFNSRVFFLAKTSAEGLFFHIYFKLVNTGMVATTLGTQPLQISVTGFYVNL
jgi:hypothetical protein